MPQAALTLPLRASRRFVASDPRTLLIWTLFALYLALSLATRVALTVKAGAGGQLGFFEVPRIFLTGLLHDAVTGFCLFSPLAVYLALLPSRVFFGRAHRLVFYPALGLALFGLVYLGIVEYFFFDEFNARFNFVAVEYLIYPHEVFVNIWQSYPVARALLACASITIVTLLGLRAWLGRFGADAFRPHSIRAHAAIIVAAAIVTYTTIDLDTGRLHENRVADEVAANGLYSFFNAALNSRLEYTDYYLTLPEHEAAKRVRRLVQQHNTTFIPGTQNPLARRVFYPGPPKLLNIVVLLQESLGAEFVGAYGDKRGLTPHIDRLASESIVFGRTYATGTRTVRGMEAVSASFPPVPAESIVKRPRNERMFNWSTVMRDAGYEPTFIYGGYGAFDNMNYFFGNNGYRVIDRTTMEKPRFSNIWGVSDEDLFENALKVFDGQHARGERIFSIVMSTSNHKPFTFPSGIEGVPAEGGGREAGVRYADHAIGRFVDALKTRPYFENTVVVIVADHGARVYGKEDFPLRSYEIPFLVYAPRHFTPRRIDRVVSQLDVAPTVLGLLGISYESAFFGRDALAGRSAEHAVPLNHNRDIALLDGEELQQLGMRKTSATVVHDASTHRQQSIARDEDGLKDAASFFQVAYQLYVRRQYGIR